MRDICGDAVLLAIWRRNGASAAPPWQIPGGIAPDAA